MTGFAVETSDSAAGTLTLELRAVNSRFLEIAFKMGEDFRPLEPQLRERISDRVKRGKLECRLNFTPHAGQALPSELNAALLGQLHKLAHQAGQVMPEATPFSLAEVLRWPGMLGEGRLDIEALQRAALHLLDRVLEGFNASRAREGQKLKLALFERLQAMHRHVNDLRPRVPAIVAAYREKLGKRIEELLPDGDPEHNLERLHQEVALFAQKIDVDEELDRLQVHLGEVERVLNTGGAAGKRLDFLMQELHREANTLGSKSVVIELSQTSVELKVLIEQMREQVQNIE